MNELGVKQKSNMRTLFLTNQPFASEKTDSRGLRAELRDLAETVMTVSASLVVIMVLATVLRATELFITTKLAIPEAHAATIESDRLSYSAKLLLKTGESITMAPGETKTYTVGFKNTGVATWKNSGPYFISIYTYDPKYRTSVFYDSAWRMREQPALMKDQSVPPGTVGFIDFNLHAPKTAGTYTETFNLAAEDLLWIPGGKFSININVSSSAATPKPVAVTPAPTSTPTPTTYNLQPTTSPDGYSATLLLRSQKTEIAVMPGETIDVTLGFKNSGTKTWTASSLKENSVAHIATDPSLSFHHLSWVDQSQIVLNNRVTKPGELALLSFKLQAPTVKGSYRPKIALVADGVSVSGGEVEIPITVTADGESSGATIPLPTVELIPEPTLRVGLFKTTTPIMITASDDYEIYDGRGKLIESVHSGQPTKIIFDFDYHTATVKTTTDTYSLRQPVRFVGRNQDTIFTIPSYSHPTGWNASLNDNKFRNVLEIDYVEDTGNLWVINELPMEMYLRGLAETSNDSEMEYQKALITAARTYAFYHWTRNTKHSGYFHVDATLDQVYRGYGNEIRTPNITKAVEATRGAIVTYNGEAVITPYYSRSDGRTRAWTEVWGGGAKPWLVSVSAEYDKGQTLWGHGVGMSARDALYRARAGAGWEEILKHYYTGIELQKRWN